MTTQYHLNHYRILSPIYTGPVDTIIELLDPAEKKQCSDIVRKHDARWGYDLDRKYHYINNYDNDDYLYAAILLERVRNIHKLIYYNPKYESWVRGNSEIPYIHFKYVETDAYKTDKDKKLILDEYGNPIADDNKLNMGVKKPFFNKTHVLEFNYYWLKRYIAFLHRVFDSNEELVLTLPEGRSLKSRYGTRKDLQKLADDVEAAGGVWQANKLRIYALSSIDEKNIQIPELVFFNNADGNKIEDWGFVDKSRNAVVWPMGKSIYNTSGFAPLFRKRTELIADIFENSMEMILAHEVAHVARGHWNLRLKEPAYSYKRNVMMNCEIQADHTAMRWLLNELLYDTVSQNLHHPVLRYSRNELIHLWSVRIFSAYLSLSWGFREDERVWDSKTIEDFIQDRKGTHPPYQFRVYSILCHAREHLEHMTASCTKNKLKLYTADERVLDESIFDEVWKRTLDMIYSFEYAFRTSWEDDDRTIMQKLRDGLYIPKKSVPDKIVNIPFMMGYMDKAQREMQQYEDMWPEVLEKLREYGMYFRM